MLLSSMSTSLKLSEIIKGQAIFNCGTAGHVSHGKSTLVHSLTGTKTQRHKKEQEKNITIKLGYANCKLYINPTTNAMYSFPSSVDRDGKPVLDPDTGDELQHHSTISFVDCPGHELYMATMISGSKVMDYALVVIAANERIPRPQTHHHLVALDYSQVSDISFALNKLDLVKQKDVSDIKERLDAYLASQGLGDRPIYPISAATGGNVQELCQFLASKVNARMSKTIAQAAKPLRMNLVRSYNVNRPSTKLEDMVGAVVGGTIESGVLTVGDQVELRPGIICVKNGKKVIQPLVGRVLSLESDHNDLHTAIPGGLVGVNLSIYAGLSNDDHLKGFVLGHVGTLPDMYDTVIGKYRILDIRIPGDTETSLPELHQGQKVDLVVNGISNVLAEIKVYKPNKRGVDKGTVELALKTPIVLNPEEKNSIAIMIDRKLVAALTVKEGRMSLPVVYPEGVDMDWQPPQYEIVNDLIPFKHQDRSFQEMVESLNFRQKRIRREVYSYPDVVKVNKSTRISGPDFQGLVDSLTYTSDADSAKLPQKSRLSIRDLLIENINTEFYKSEPRFNGEGHLTMNNVIHRDKIVKFVDKFVTKLLTCPSCKGARSTLVRTSGSIQRYCHNCPAVTGLHTTNIGQIA